MRGVVAALICLLVVAACDGRSQVLRAPASALHEVDGVTMTAERPCELLTDDCARKRAAALAALGLPASTHVTRVSLASDGYTYGGFQLPVIVVLDLDGGVRRAVTLVCGPAQPPVGSPPASVECVPTPG